MSEYRLHLLVQELIRLVGSTASPELNIEKIQNAQQSSQPPISTKQVFKQLFKYCADPEQFKKNFDELKAKNIDCFGNYVQLLALIAEDKKLKSFLETNFQRASLETASETPSMISTSSIPSKDKGGNLLEIRSQLKKVVAQVQKSPFKKQTDQQSKVIHPNYVLPEVPDWTMLRPHSSLDFMNDSNLCSQIVPAIGSIPACSQENILIEDLLYVLEGIEGEVIVPDPLEGPYEKRSFTISNSIDPSLRDLTKQILPLASYYSMVVRFIQEYENFEVGKVNHALSNAMRIMIEDYKVLICQFETFHRRGDFSLQKMWFYVQPTLHTMGLLSEVAYLIGKSEAKGGKVLSLLHEKTLSLVGDSKGEDICLYLTKSAAEPYMTILERWIYKGVISDPFQEFLVEDNELIKKEELPLDYSADYWEKRYTIRRERIPVFLEKSSDFILRTGKYLNVIRQCGKNVKSPQAESIVYSVKEMLYIESIEKAYLFASKTLLDMLMDENDLMGRLRSVKHYFLLDQGDFIVQFMDNCEAELCKNITDIVSTRLESLLELVLRLSGANNDPYKDDVRTEFLPYGLSHQMSKILSIQTHTEKDFWLQSGKPLLVGLDSFSFSYEVRWPISLVLNRKAMSCYQMIFRHLFHCKHIERQLCRVWICNKVGKMFTLKTSRMYVASYALRQRMLDCIQNLLYYMMVEVIEPNWIAFLAKINEVNNVDDVLACHSDFLDICLKDCMLTNPSLLHSVNRLMGVCKDFCKFIQVTSSSASKFETNDIDSFEKKIADFNNGFTTSLIGLLGLIGEIGRENNKEKLVNVLYRLNYNSFYTEQLELFCASRSVNTAQSEETSG